MYHLFTICLILICIFILQYQWHLPTDYDALGDDIDFESDGINCCIETTFDDAEGNTNDMLRMNENTFTFLSPVAEKLHQDISNSSLSNLKMHTQNTIQAS